MGALAGATRTKQSSTIIPAVSLINIILKKDTMPYIAKDLRIEALTKPKNAGELNYCITKIIQSYLKAVAVDQPKYNDYNSVIGALECCKLELYRRLIADYEDQKRRENGDVYGGN